MDLPAAVREHVARSVKEADAETFAALRLVSRSWQDAADQIERRITIRVAADPPPDELPAIAKLLRNLGGRYRKVQEVTVMLSGGDVRPSVTHALASAGACGQQLSVPGAVFADMLEPTLRASLADPQAERVSCFAQHGYMLLGRDPGWRPEAAADQGDAAAVAALLPSWVPLAAGGDPAEQPAPTPGAEEGTAARAPAGGEESGGVAASPPAAAAPGDDGTVPSGVGEALLPEGTASAEPSSTAALHPTFAEAGTGPAEEEDGRDRRRHVVLDAPLWPRLVELDPELPAELLRAGVTVHLVAETRVPTSQMELTGVHGISAYLPAELDARRDLPVVVGDVFAALLAEPALRHVWVRFDRQMVWDPPLAQILEETLALKLAVYMGVDLKHNCHHLWQKDGRDWDQAILFFTQYQAAPEAAAVAYRQAAEEGCFARQPEEICSLYEGEDSQDEPETTTGDVFMQPEPAPDPQAEPAIASLSLSTTAA